MAPAGSSRMRRLRWLAHPAIGAAARRLPTEPVPAQRYFQREMQGIADVGNLHRQRPRRARARFQSAHRATPSARGRSCSAARSGPVPLPDDVAARGDAPRCARSSRRSRCAAWAAWTSCSTATPSACSKSIRGRRPAWRCTVALLSVCVAGGAGGAVAHTCVPACRTSCQSPLRTSRADTVQRHRDRLCAAGRVWIDEPAARAPCRACRLP